jgi:CheY-like chemotaxis protein
MRVSDTGVGIAKETLEHIFEPFFTTKDISSGTGLGLSSAYGIIERHNGLIRVKSQVDRGTEFSVYIPAVKEDAPAKQVKQQTTVSGREMILFVDDDEVLQELGGEILNSLDYLPLIAKNGIEAIQQYKKNQDTIKLVILDMIMPKMSGAEIYNKLVEINPDVKVLLSSGYSIDGQASDIISRGCNGFIQKPFNRNELADKIKEILETTDK